MQITDEIIAKIDELRALVESDATALSFGVNIDQGGVSYHLSVTDQTGRTRSAQDRIPNPPATA